MKNLNLFFEKYEDQFNKILRHSLFQNKKEIIELTTTLRKINKLNKVILIGNGGSAAIASHASIDFNKVANIRSINFTDNSNMTALSNDIGYNNVFSENLKYVANKNDILIAISSSGNSINIINAIKISRKMKFSKVITFTGMKPNNKVRKLGDINIWVNSNIYNFIENIHQIILLSCIDSFNDIKF
jgi:D-sedoheptulose 7-phosphate isomerase